MNEEFLDEFVRMQRKLGLERWEFVVNVKPDAEMGGIWANVDVTEQTHHAIITFNDDLLKQDIDKQRMTIIHELLHVHLQQMVDIVKHCIEKLGGAPAAGETLYEAFRQQNELVVDRLARALERVIL